MLSGDSQKLKHRHVRNEPSTAVGLLQKGANSVALATLAGIALFSLSSAVHAGPAKKATVSNVLYVHNNDPDAGENAILLYRRGADGRLTYVRSYFTGGRGVGNPEQLIGPNDADQDLITNPEHTLLFAVNAGSDSIAVFNIAADGTLTPVKGSPFPSGGVNPVSLGLTGNILYVVNKSQDPERAAESSEVRPNYTGFRVAGNGMLTPIPHSTVELPEGDSPTQALVKGDLMFGFEFYPQGVNLALFGIPGPVKSGAVESFKIRPNGRLEAAQGSPSPLPVYTPPDNALAVLIGLPEYNVPLNGILHPTQRILYVNFVTYTQVGVYTYDANGAVTFEGAVGQSPAPGAAVAPCWDAISKDGKYLYVLDAFSNNIFTYDLANPLAPVETGVLSLTSTTPGAAAGFRLSLDPAGKFLYVVDQNVGDPSANAAENNVQVLSVGANGLLSPVANSTVILPIDTYARAQGILAL